MAGGIDVAGGVMRAIEVITPEVSLGSADTLIERPTGLTRRVVETDAQASCGITPGLPRPSVGVEHIDGIGDDLDRASVTAR